MNQESRAHSVLRNSAWSMAGYIVPILSAAFVTPIVVFGLGEHNYGVYAFLISIVAILGIVDLGISTAVSKKVTEEYSKGDFSKLRETLRTANGVALVIGAIGLVACITLGAGGHALLSNGIAPHIATLYVLVGLIFFVNAIGLSLTVVPSSLQRFDIGVKVGTILAIATSIANIIVVKTSGSLHGLLLIQLAASVMTVAMTGFYTMRLIPGVFPFSFAWPKEAIREMYAFGFKTFLANVGMTSSSYLGRIIIPVFLGPAALTYYSVPASVAQKIPGITGTLSGILFPLTASLASLGETERIKTAYIRSFRLITVLAAAASSSVVIFAEPILRYWLNQEFAFRSKNVLILLAISHFVLALYGPLYNFLLGLGRLSMVTVVSFVMAGVNALLLFALLPFLDIEGAAWAYLISVLPIAYAIYRTERIYLKIELRTHYYLKLSVKTAVTVGASYLISYYMWLPLTTSFASLLMTGPLSVMTYLALYKAFGFYEEEDWKDLSRFALSVFKKR